MDNNHPDLTAEAVRLRREGYSVRRISARLGLFFGEVVELLKNAPTAKQEHDDSVTYREAVRSLRREGHDERVIRAVFGEWAD